MARNGKRQAGAEGFFALRANDGRASASKMVWYIAARPLPLMVFGLARPVRLN
jgi:hypothetical protein